MIVRVAGLTEQDESSEGWCIPAKALQWCVDRGVQHGFPAGEEHRPGIFTAFGGGRGSGPNPGAHLLIGAVEDLLEERFLVREVVIERATRDAAAADDLLGTGLVIAPRAEQLGRDCDEPLP